MRTSKMTSLLDVLSATVLAVAVAGSVVPASAAIRMGGGGFHGGGFGTLAAGLIAGCADLGRKWSGVSRCRLRDKIPSTYL
jgi:hypothetical protein